MILNFPVGNDGMRNRETNSLWNFDGLYFEGPLKGKHLGKVLASPEFWHSWKQFLPNTTVHK